MSRPHIRLPSARSLDTKTRLSRFRCIASDRRGFGNSDWNGSEPVSSPIDYSVFAADTVHLLEKVKPGPFIFVAASMGPGETIEAYFQSQFVRDN
jgi:pimeloyl-ACP methyl ester carboxylesterase